MGVRLAAIFEALALLTRWLLPAGQPVTAVHTAAAALAFLAVSPVVLGWSPFTTPASRAEWRRAGGQVVMALVLFGGAGLVWSGLPRGVWARAIGMLLVPAAVEEAVFRWLLPARLDRALVPATSQRRGRCTRPALAAQLLAQAAFALAHLIRLPHLAGVHATSELLRLFASGLLYAALFTRGGPGLAVGIHASLNAAAVMAASQRLITIPAIRPAIAVVVGVWALSRRGELRPDGPAPATGVGTEEVLCAKSDGRGGRDWVSPRCSPEESPSRARRATLRSCRCMAGPCTARRLAERRSRGRRRSSGSGWTRRSRRRRGRDSCTPPPFATSCGSDQRSATPRSPQNAVRCSTS